MVWQIKFDFGNLILYLYITPWVQLTVSSPFGKDVGSISRVKAEDYELGLAFPLGILVREVYFFKLQ